MSNWRQTEVRSQPTAQSENKACGKEAARCTAGGIVGDYCDHSGQLAKRGATHAHAGGFHRFVTKTAPDGSLQGFRIPYIEGLSTQSPVLVGEIPLEGA